MSARSRLWMAATLAAGVAGPADASGQMIVNLAALDPARPNVVHLSGGAEYGFVSTVGIGRAFQVGGRTLLLSASATAPWAEADGHDYGTQVGATVEVVRAERWRLAAGVGGTLRGTTNTLGSMKSVGADGVLVGGYWKPGWFASVEAGYDGAIATHVEHSDYYRDRYHPDARDGWYVDTGANIRVGLAGGVTMGRWDVVLRVGKSRDRLGDHQLLPGYATLGANLRF